MIDTIKLAIPINDSQDLSKVAFETSLNAVRIGSTSYFRTFRNPIPAERRLGIYRPRLTFIRRPTGIDKSTNMLLVEMSLPKLIFGNNFEEIAENDFGTIISSLTRNLKEMGAPIMPEQIQKASVVKIDLCKNIILPEYVSVPSITSQIRKADISTIYDPDYTQFRNGGHIFHVHCNTSDVAFYDKVADLRQGKISEKRGFERDYYVQTKLLKLLQRNKRDVLRVEVRLNSKKKIGVELKAIGIDCEDLTFENIFRADLAKGILLSHWNKIFKTIPKVLLDSDSPEQLFYEIIKDNKITPQKALAKLGFILLSGQCEDSRQLRNVIENRFSRSTWTGLRKAREPPDKTQLKTLLYIGRVISETKTLRSSEIGLD